MYDKFDKFGLGDYPPEIRGRFNSFITTQFDDSLSVEMQVRSIIKWAIENFDGTVNQTNHLIDFINDLIEYMNEFIETFDEKYQETILNKMQEWYDNGELETLINESLDTKYHEMDNRLTTQFTKTEKKVNSQFVNIIDFGVTVENSGVDDTLNTQNALDYAITNDLALYIPREITVELPNAFSMKGLRKLIVEGGINTPELTIGYDSRYGASTFYDINRVSDTLKVVGLMNGEVTLRTGKKLYLYANGSDVSESSIAYSKFTIGFVSELEIFSEGSNIGWINENIFVGGNFKKVSIDGNFPHNNNSFYSPFIENAVVNINNARANTFYSVRFEGTNNIVFGELANSNKFIKTYQGGSITLVDNIGKVPFTDNGKNNDVITLNQLMNERIGVTLTKDSKNINYGHLTPTPTGLKINVAFITLLDTGIVPFDFDLGFSIVSDQPLFRGRLTLYDGDMNKIHYEKALDSNNLDKRESEMDYQNGANAQVIGVQLNHSPTSLVKFIRFEVSAGSNLSTFKELRFTVTASKNNNLRAIESNVNSGLYPRKLTIPTHTYNLKYGDIVYFSGDIRSDGDIGWIYTTSGWFPFGTIKT